jgi:nucleotide-binding universal stress UspA family protein
MNSLKTILVPVDFSTGSRSALAQATRLAGLNGASLHVLHVVDTAAIDMIAVSRRMSFEREAAIAAEGAQEALVRWLAQAGAPASCQTTIVVGVPLHEILEHIHTLKPDLVVAGITGSGESKLGAGSVSCKLVRKARTKVLLVRAAHPNPFQKIIACIDFSETSREVAAQAHRVAVQDGARVDFLHVWREPWLNLPYAHAPFGASVPMTPPAISGDYLQATESALRDFVSEASQDIESRALLLQATNYGNGIVAHARQTEADLIVMGRKGRTNLRYVLLGSTAEQLLTILPTALLVVNPADSET